jgi:hypothetical protein
MRVLRIREIERARDSITTTCELDDMRFHFTVWYEDIDLGELAREHGDDLIDRLAFHVALFQVNAVASLQPDAIELGRFARYATPRFVELWSTIFRRVWAQWRWRHDLPDYTGPRFVDAPADAPAARPSRTATGTPELLAFCGGGKDSLVALKLLERARLPFATLGYSCSIYGTASEQHALLDRLGTRTARMRAERAWMFDDFLDAPVPRLRPNLGVRSILAAETPASVFAALPLALARGYRGSLPQLKDRRSALPLALARGYRGLIVAHERSTNTGNLAWGATGEEVNHQWGKGWEAEQLLDDYVRGELLANVRYFSVLLPVHDEVIFELLARDAELAPLTHSCNVLKPWCGACAKCAYVWLQMAAHLPEAIVDATFGDEFGDRADNEHWFRELLGLADHTPFECVGGAAEAQLALAQLAARRPLGPRLAALAAGVMPQLVDAAAAARRRLIP